MAADDIEPRSLADRLPRGKLRKLLDDPVGSPVPLTREEAIAIVNAGIGGRPDLPSGKEYVRRVRGIWRGLQPRE
jgi:hypothetical protein